MKHFLYGFLTLLIIASQPVHALTSTPSANPATNPVEVGEQMSAPVAEPVDSTESKLPATERIMDPEAGAAPSDMMIAPPIEQVQPETVLGQDHSYTVTFRGNGEAVVTMRIVFSNLNNEPMSELKLKIPKVSPQNVMAYQLQREPQCLRYKAYPMIPDSRQVVTMEQPQCEEYGAVNYFDYWYGKTTYYKSDAMMNGNEVTIGLPMPVMTNESGSILLQYNAVGYTKKNWAGGYAFDFETATVNDKIRNLQIGINTDSDLVLKGSQGQVNYSLDAAAPAMMKMDARAGGLVNSQMDNLYQNIGYGTVNKNATNLQPNDSYSVPGAYGKNWVQIYASEILITILVLVVLIALMVMLSVFLWKRYGKNVKGNSRTILTVIGVGFGTALVLSGFTGALMFVTFLLNRLYWYDVTGVIMLGLFVISAGIFLFLFISPALVMGVKRGVWAGVGTAAATIVWMKIFFLIMVTIVIVAKLISSEPSSPVYPLMKGVTMDSVQSAPVVMPMQK